MSRLSLASRDNIPEKQLALFDDLVKEYGLTTFATQGILAHVPMAWKIDRDLRDFLRYESSLPEDVVKLSMLLTGRELDCQFIWNTHAGSAIQAGVPEGVMEALRDRSELPKLAAKHVAVIQYGREIYRAHRVSAGTFSLAKEQFGERGIVELSLLFGSYHMLAILLNSTDAKLRPNRTEQVLPIC